MNANVPTTEKLIMHSNTMESSKLRQHLEEVESGRRELQTELGNIVYPVLTLPPELVSQIFVHCLPSHGRVRPKVDTPPLSLSQICRDWREIALSSCELWSSLDLLFTAGSPNDGALPLLETWFSRAKDYPLSVTIRSEDEELDPKIISLISSVAGRIQSLELQGRREDLQLFATPHATFTRLRRLAVIYPDSSFAYHPDFASDILENIDAPSLLELTIPSAPRSFNRYPSLTSIKLRSIDERGLVDLSHQFPQLLHLTASVTGEWNSDDDSDSDNSSSDRLSLPTHIILPRLQSLHLLRGEFDLFTLPSLRRLENPEYYVANESDRLLAFVERSACDLDHIGLDFDDLVKCLEVIPSVASLNVLLHPEEMPQFKELMTTAPTPLPHLRILGISSHQENFDYLSFIQLIRARRGPPTTTTTTTRLESVQVEFYDMVANVDKIPVSARTELESLISGGLKLQVTCSGVIDSSWPAAMGESPPLTTNN
ncbi:hypothetical protein C8F04DRAFT_279802 [Mycena alexandri]|uniref:F-box domain-containing protein n=1 Tax=Mycena alexandri TaxID=1745969 RepID=A0AAD6T5N0_9AGAR|nr:hypothetical protein C8F04DRAFT_279802 [Mycena alexandri]